MLKTSRFRYLMIFIAVLILFSSEAHAYIDPGTSGALFSSFAYVFAALATVLGFLFWPIKKIYYIIKEKLKAEKK